jgi:glucose/arabinose dehydrogenase
MPSTTVVGIVLLLVAVQSADTRGCSPRRESPSATTPGTNVPGSDVFTTQDGVRFTASAVATNLEIPWSMAFAPDGRLFVCQ